MRSLLVPLAITLVCMVAVVFLALAGSPLAGDGAPKQLPTPTVADETSRAGSAKVDSVVLARFDFDDEQGDPEPQGWTWHDLTADPNAILTWHVDDFAGLAGYAPLAGARSLWCGSRAAPPDLGGDAWPGYGNNWSQCFESVAFPVVGSVHIGFTASHDVEPDMDFGYLEYLGSSSTWTVVATLTGEGVRTVAADIPASVHSGTLRLRLRFASDSAWSDEDGLYDTQGAIVIDDLHVQDETGLVDHQDFEAESVGARLTTDGRWMATTTNVPFGMYAGLVSGSGVLQEDPTVTNATNCWGFFQGSPDDYGCAGHPEQAAVPHHRGAYPPVRANCIDNEVRSPWIRLDRDEAGGLLVEKPDSVTLHFQVYRDLPYTRSVFYAYRWRFRTDGVLSYWQDTGSWYHGNLKDWHTQERQIAVPVGADEIQVALEAIDAVYHYPSSDPCHSQAPLFDNVRISAAGRVDAFHDVGAGLAGVHVGDVDWGDFDGDGDLDVLLVGATDTGKVARVYRNDGIGFTDVGAPLLGVSHGSAAWGDYDDDGDLDILLAGDTGNEAERAVTRLYRNDAGAFSEVQVSIPGLMGDFADRGLDWGDYDNDGDLDIIIVGRGYPGYPYQYRCRVYRNDGGGTFTDIAAALPALSSGAVAWGDYDVDGDLDLLLSGSLTTGASTARVYRNDGGGQFVNIGAALTAIHDGSVAWGDYDNDGDPDIALTGHSPGISYASRIYRNDQGIFVDTQAALTNLGGGSADWGDCDADGDLDLLLTGWDGSTRLALIYRNDSGVFRDLGAGLPGVIYGSAGWCDYDGDGRLDVVLAGWNPTDGSFTRIYDNQSTGPNSLPTAPTGLHATVADTEVTLNWSAATDAETPGTGLMYNVRLGTTPGGGEICSGMADAANGFRLVARNANAGHRCTLTLHLDPPTEQDLYYWSVQAVDPSFSGGPFAAEQSFVVGAAGFVDLGAGLAGLENPAVAWGDYDGDGDLDLLLSGMLESVPVTLVYRNDGGGVFTPLAGGKSGAVIAAVLPGVRDGAMAWGDYDNDGDLDLYLSGIGADWTHQGGLFRNDGGGAFTPVAPGVVQTAWGSAAWGDGDADGDLDLLLTGGTTFSGYDTRYYRNDGSDVFTDIPTGVPGVFGGNAAWADFDDDGDLDFVIGGEWDEGGLARIYANDGAGHFTDAGADLPGLTYARLAWGDCDSDGDPDLLLAGNLESGGYVTRVYRNDGGAIFTDLGAGLPGLTGINPAWGDVDDDGDLDLLLTGSAGSGGMVSQLYRNNGRGTFALAALGPLAGVMGAAAFGDHDGDGDLDLVLVGWTGSGAVAAVYGNNPTTPNTPPAPPIGLRQSQAGGVLILSWDAALDSQTPTEGLSYNLRIGTTPGGGEVMAAMADPVGGRRRVMERGNAQQRTSWPVRLPTSWVRLYCSVQAIDASYAGSPFGAELVVASSAAAVPAMPSAYALHNCAPNPFNPRTKLSFDLPTDGRVRLDVFDAQGRRVCSLLDDARAAGHHELEWVGTDDDGRALASGTYLCRMESGDFRQTVRMTLVR